MSKQLDEILAKHNGELGVTWEDPDVVTPATVKALTALIQSVCEEARINEHAVIKERIENRTFNQRGMDAMDERLAELKAHRPMEHKERGKV